MRADIHKYVASCSCCSQAKVPHTFHAGKRTPLPLPQWPWTHIPLDFITDLPESLSNIVLLVIPDQFSHTMQLIPLPVLPTTFKTMELVFNQGF